MTASTSSPGTAGREAVDGVRGGVRDRGGAGDEVLDLGALVGLAGGVAEGS